MKIIILSPVLHDGKQLHEGDIGEMEEKDARALINVGAAKAVRQKAESKLEQKLDDAATGSEVQEDSAPAKDAGEADNTTAEGKQE